MRRRPGGALLLRAGCLVLGGSLVALGLVLVVLPGPLTLPPVLLGLYVLSLEFPWAQRLLSRAEDRAREAWAAARRSPVRSSLVTGTGLVLAGVAVWAVLEHDLLTHARTAVGL